MNEPDIKTVSRIGAVAAVLVLVTSLSEILITFLPGGYESPVSAGDWFAYFDEHAFMALRNLGLLNIVMTTLQIPLMYAIYALHRKEFGRYAGLALLIAMLGAATFYATNRAFPMLELSKQYASASTIEQKAALTAAGEAMLAVGKSHTPGTFLGFFLGEAGAILMSVVMLKGRIFGKPTVYIGLTGFCFLLAFDVCVSFVPSLWGAALPVAMVGGISMMAWYVLMARRLFRLGSSR